MPQQTIIHDDCLHAMQQMEDNSIDFIVTDSPYGISFMSKHWDQQIPPPEYWKEMLRICKPGSYMACAGLPRMMHRLTSIVEDSGWIIRDMIIHIFGSGFPKSNNFGKKLGEPWNGYGTALKPAWEGWTIAMKPLDGTFAFNAEKWGVAGINIDDCRIPTIDNRCRIGGGTKGKQSCYGKSEVYDSLSHGLGRWPANIILDEEAAEALDQMTGILKSGKLTLINHIRKKATVFIQGYNKKLTCNLPANEGGASRFFYTAKASASERNAGCEGMELKESDIKLGLKIDKTVTTLKRTVNARCNNHPTVKPLALMRYLITLLAPPGKPTLLDPFAGSGSTLCAAKQLGITAIGIEKEAEYCEIAKARIAHAKFIPVQPDLFDEKEAVFTAPNETQN